MEGWGGAVVFSKLASLDPHLLQGPLVAVRRAHMLTGTGLPLEAVRFGIPVRRPKSDRG
jgi:hypothetical protein